MGDVVQLRGAGRGRRKARARRVPPVLYLDLADPLCYLAAEQVARVWPGVRLRVACGSRLSGVSEGAWAWGLAARRATELRIPLLPPEDRPRMVELAQLAGARAIAAGQGTPFLLAALRLAYAGGYDLGCPSTIEEAAAAAGLDVEETLAAGTDPRWWPALDVLTDGLRARGVERLPALRVGHELVAGEDRIAAYLALGAGRPPRRTA